MPLFGIAANDALATVYNVCPAGERHPLLIIAKGESADVALALAQIALRECHWVDAVLSEAKPLVGAPEQIEDEAVRSAALHADENGYSIVVY